VRPTPIDIIALTLGAVEDDIVRFLYGRVHGRAAPSGWEGDVRPAGFERTLHPGSLFTSTAPADRAAWEATARACPPAALARLRDTLAVRFPTMGGLWLQTWPGLPPMDAAAASGWRSHPRRCADLLRHEPLPLRASQIPGAVRWAHLLALEHRDIERALPLNPDLRADAEAGLAAEEPRAIPVVVSQALLAGDLTSLLRRRSQLGGGAAAALVDLLSGAADLKKANTAFAKEPIGDLEELGLIRLLRPLLLSISDQPAKQAQALKTCLHECHSPISAGLQHAAVRPCLTDNPLHHLIAGVCLAWHGAPPNVDDQAARAEALGWTWVAAELRALHGGAPLPGFRSLISLGKVEPAWAKLLSALEHRLEPEGARRLGWEIDPERVQATPFEERLTRGEWRRAKDLRPQDLRYPPRGKGAPVPLSRADIELLNTADMDRFSPTVRWDLVRMLRAAAAHPRVVDPSGRPLAVRVRTCAVRLEEAGGHIEAVFSPAPGRAVSVRPVQGVWEVHVASPGLAARLEPLAGQPLRVPAAERARLLRYLAQLGDEIDLDAEAEAPADPTPALLLRPAGTGVWATLVVMPAGDEGPAHPPGEGPLSVRGHGPEGPTRVTRDPDAERAAAGRARAAIPDLGPALERGFVDLARALELIDAAQDQPGLLRIAWPPGAGWSVRRPMAPPRIGISAMGRWLQANGGLILDPQRALPLVELLAAARAGVGRFLRLSDGAYVALSDQLRRQLAALDRLARSRGGQVELPALAAELLEPLVDADDHPDWAALLQRRRAPPAELPPPAGLRAELRPYQAEALRWLQRLSAWAPGACLADDMGLGKTVVALALLLQRAPLGPALVVAPASVVGNWLAEAARFAPGLRLRDLAAGDRGLEGVGPGDVVVASYGLLLSEVARLQAMPWATAVLDEAHQIKNASTRRHQAAVGLRAGLRLALTGTPIENRLEELHALMQFVAPDLLGPEARFRERFARPIADGDADATATLRGVVAPLLLRRTKAEVLTELPARTDIDLLVPLEPAHAATYEVIRREAEAALEAKDAANPLHLLAALTRLRLAACHPALVGHPGLASTKHERLRELLIELKAGGHRVLVFSQFVKHLELVRAWLDEEGLSFAWLDGATPRPARDAAVAAFQAGRHDVFLLSLKAGGAGLNLTAADYVVHLDPWWNPAVEDQASDRAHRMGQQRPVTVYRLISQGTVEQQILDLHHRKRALADRLLDGADGAAGLDAAQLLALLQEATVAGRG
jgi:superfamily II DNA or RNA helicase